MEKRPHPVRPLGQERRLGTRIQRSHQRPKERIPHARHYVGSCPPAGRDRKRGDQNQALGRSRGGLTSKIHICLPMHLVGRCASFSPADKSTTSSPPRRCWRASTAAP